MCPLSRARSKNIRPAKGARVKVPFAQPNSTYSDETCCTYDHIEGDLFSLTMQGMLNIVDRRMKNTNRFL